jgi:hypothetical protein
MTPLQIFMTIWQQQVTTVPYVECVNTPVDTDSLPNEWGSAVYLPETTTDATLGSRPWVEERGQFLVGLFTRSGKGPAALDAAVAAVRQAFHGAALDGLWLMQVDGPHDLDPEADGEWWRLALTVQYVYQFRRDATGPLYGEWQGFDNATLPSVH